MEPENDDFQKESPFQGLIFRCKMLNFRGVYSFKPSSGTSPKFNIAPGNQWLELEDEFPFGMVIFQGLC